MEKSLVFPDYWNERIVLEMEDKGYLNCLQIRYKGKLYPVYFSDMTRLRQDFEDDQKAGRNYFAENNLIILTRVTMEEIGKFMATETEWFDNLR